MPVGVMYPMSNLLVEAVVLLDQEVCDGLFGES